MRLHVKLWMGFTIAELIVVVTILAILATVGFLALSWYSQDAKDSAIKTNVRSVYTAITAESAMTGNSPRYYVVHDSAASLSWGIVVFDGTQTTLTGGDWNASNTNYSAGNPDWTKLKLNKDKFRVSSIPNGIFEAFRTSNAAYDAKLVTAWAADFSVMTWTDGKRRIASYVQVAGISPSTWAASVAGNYPVNQSGSVKWLVRDPSSSSSTGALMDWSIGEKIMDGACWSSANTATDGYPISNLCSTWTASWTDISWTDGTYDWTCASTWTPVSCSAPRNAMTSCSAWKAAGFNTDGTYFLDPDGAVGNPWFSAYCDMNTDGGWWTLLWSALKNGSGTGAINWTLATDTSMTNADPLGGNTPWAWGTTNAKLKAWSSVSVTTVMVRENSSYDKMTFGSSAPFNLQLSSGTLNAYSNVSLNFYGCNNVHGYCWSPSVANALRTPTTQPCSNGYYNAGNQGINLVWYHDGYCNSGWASYANKGFFTKWYSGVQETAQSVNRITNGVTFWWK